MMIIYPAIDIKGGKCIRMKQGGSGITFDNDEPSAVAEEWQEAGAKYIHIVDLDGAIRGSSYNDEVLKGVLAKTVVPVQIGGGIRSLADVERKLGWGAERIILGTAAIKNPDFVREAVSKFGDKIAVGIDAINGEVVVSGREEVTDIKPLELFKSMTAIGVKTFIYTDITSEGLMTGPNIDGIKEMLDAAPGDVDIIAAGGISGMDDLAGISKLNVNGVVIAKALYMGSLDLKEVIKVYELENFFSE